MTNYDYRQTQGPKAERPSFLSVLFALLMSFALPACQPGRHAEMQRELLRAREMNKAYEPFTTDSVMKQVVAYYDRHGTPNERMEAHYLLGCAYRDMGEAPRAIDCYHKAISIADESSHDNENLTLLMAIYGQMAELYDGQNLPSDELLALNKYGEYALRAKDTLEYIHNIELMSHVYDLLGDTTKMLNCLYTARHLFKERKMYDLAARTLSTIIYVNICRGELDSASVQMKEYETMSGLFDCHGNIEKGREVYYYFKGLFYLSKAKIDKAEFFMRKLLLSNYKVNAYRGMMHVYRYKKQPDSIAKYSRLFEASYDSLNDARRTADTHRITALYDYQRFKDRAEIETRKAERARMELFLLLLLFALTVIVGFSFYRQYRLKRIRNIILLSTQLEQSITQYRKARNESDLLKKDIETLKRRKEQEIKSLEKKMLDYEERWRRVSGNDKMAVLMRDDIVIKFREMSRGRFNAGQPNSEDWEILRAKFAQNMNSAYAVIDGQDTKLSELEKRVYMLTMLGFTNGEISALLEVSPQRITNLKSRTNFKLFGDASASTLLTNAKKEYRGIGVLNV